MLRFEDVNQLFKTALRKRAATARATAQLPTEQRGKSLSFIGSRWYSIGDRWLRSLR